MPCRDWEDGFRTDEGYSAAKVDKLTRMLCYLCNAVQINDGRLIKANKELSDWWKEHRVADAKRRKAEADKLAKQKLKQAALAKLTDEEKRVLGL